MKVIQRIVEYVRWLVCGKAERGPEKQINGRKFAYLGYLD
jgi:hypothetical protein